MSVKHSVTTCLASALLTVVIISVASTSVALYWLHHVLQDARVINVAGSLRMQSYRLGYDSLVDTHQLPLHIAAYQLTLDTPIFKQASHAAFGTQPATIRRTYHNIQQYWPVLRYAILAGDRALYQREIDAYIRQIDLFVLALQHYAEWKLKQACLTFGIASALSIVIVLVTRRYFRQQVVKPLTELCHASLRVKNGKFDTQLPPYPLSNELGVLRETFLEMTHQLGDHYRQQDRKISEKQRDLSQANTRLNTLYQCSQFLNINQLNIDGLKRVLEYVRIHHNFLYVTLETFDEPPHVIQSGYHRDTLPISSLPVMQGAKQLGVLQWQQVESHMPPEQKLMRGIANMLGRALYLIVAQRESQRLILLEERHRIAHDLHDSLSQSFTFLRIQITQLRRVLPPENDQARTLVERIDTSLKEVHTQFRELLTTFRLHFDEPNLHLALEQILAPLKTISTATIHCKCLLPAYALDGQRQTHLLSIIREAVLNAIKHAEARNIWIQCNIMPDGSYRALVRDDGKGITRDAPAGHYGLVIMQERAKKLNGNLSIHPAPQHGTEVYLVFAGQPKTHYD